MTIVSPRDRLFTVETFLAWDGFDPNHHYQLIDGRIVMMAPSSRNHALLQSALLVALANALRGTGWRAVAEAGVARSLRSNRWFVADLLVTDEKGRRGLVPYESPVLVAEILSPSSADLDRTVKLADYKALPSVCEIVLVEQDHPLVEVHRREADGLWIVERHDGMDAALHLHTGPTAIALAELYRDVEIDRVETAP